MRLGRLAGAFWWPEKWKHTGWYERRLFCVSCSEAEKPPIFQSYCFLEKTHFPGIWQQMQLVDVVWGDERACLLLSSSAVGTRAHSPWSPSFPKQHNWGAQLRKQLSQNIVTKQFRYEGNPGSLEQGTLRAQEEKRKTNTSDPLLQAPFGSCPTDPSDGSHLQQAEVSVKTRVVSPFWYTTDRARLSHNAENPSTVVPKQTFVRKQPLCSQPKQTIFSCF